jgi:hypothetical protein
MQLGLFSSRIMESDAPNICSEPKNVVAGEMPDAYT